MVKLFVLIVVAFLQLAVALAVASAIAAVLSLIGTIVMTIILAPIAIAALVVVVRLIVAYPSVSIRLLTIVTVLAAIKWRVQLIKGVRICRMKILLKVRRNKFYWMWRNAMYRREIQGRYK